MTGRPDIRIALTGFMGVGKSSVARHMAHLLDCHRIELDAEIEEAEGMTIAEIIDHHGIAAFRAIETACLAQILTNGPRGILSLGGGTWTMPANRELIKSRGFKCVWLESTFEHCWYNIKASRKERPLARSKAEAMKLFEDRQRVYCLADSHFIIRPEFSSFEIALQIVEQVI